MELEILPLLSRWAHVLAAIIIFGGVAFMRFSFVPAATEAKASAELREAIRRRWSRLIGPAVLFILVSGLYNAYLKAITYDLNGVYLAFLMLKIILGMVVFVLVSLLFGRGEKAKKIRERELHWLNIISVLLLAIVLMAGAMKMDNPPKKNKNSEKIPAVTDVS